MDLPPDEGQKPLAEAVPAEAISVSLPTTLGHRSLVLMGSGFVVFEIFFLTLYGSDFWFGSDLSKWGIVAVIAALISAHFLLSWIESPGGCLFFSPIWKGRPPLVYRRWISLDESGITFGTRHVIWSAVDSLALTFWGNVQVRSRAVCGPHAREADLVLKFPLGAAAAASQKAFIERAKSDHPSASMNDRLCKRLSAREPLGTALVQCLGGAFMLVILFDLGHSTFTFLEMMKEYYLAQTSARDGQLEQAQLHFATGEKILTHPPPLSWVTGKLIKGGAVGAGVQQSRSEALWRLGRKDEAIEAARKAEELAPTHFRFPLRLARLLAESGKAREARQQIHRAIDYRQDSLLPRLYMLAVLKGGANPASAARLYDLYLQDLIDTVFGQEPLWPPGGNRYLHELIYLDDATFIFDRLIGKREESGKKP